MPILNRSLINVSNDDEHYETLVERQTKNYETLRIYNSIPRGSAVVVQRETVDP